MIYLYIMLVLLVCRHANATEDATKSDKCSDLCSARDTLRSCSCDDNCYKYGTCCKDSENVAKMSPENKEYECHSDRTSTPVYAKRTCSKSFQGHDSHRILCEENVNDRADVLGSTLVTQSSKTYWNKNCAICNEEEEEKLIRWTVQVICPARHGTVKFNRLAIEKNLTYNQDIGEWGLIIPDGFLVCSLVFKQPSSADGKLKYCAPNMIASCPSNSSDSGLVEKCLMYHAERRDKTTGQYYRNVHCALCNGIREDDLKCVGRKYSPLNTKKGSDVLVTSYKSGEWIERKGAERFKCSLGNIWDPLVKRCRKSPPVINMMPQSMASSKETMVPFSLNILMIILLINKYTFH